MDDREFIHCMERADTEELIQLLRKPTRDQERLLELHFGPSRYDRLRKLAMSAVRRSTKKGNVVVLHGIMGGELTVSLPDGRRQYVWMSIPRIIRGGLGSLRMRNGKSESNVCATGILKRWYGELLLDLAQNYDVKAFFYDWRMPIEIIAEELRKRIDNWFGPEAPVDLVAHSMGGLVCRTFILRHQNRWNKGGRLILLGTPNHGSFAIPRTFVGIEETVRLLSRFDLKHNLPEVVEIVNSFAGSYQMLPSPRVIGEAERLYRTETYAPMKVSQKFLDAALRFHDSLAEVVDGERMTYIAGCNRKTVDGICNWERLRFADGYSTSLKGDGTVPHQLGFLYKDGHRIPTFFANTEHGALPSNPQVVAAIHRILGGEKPNLAQEPSSTRGRDGAVATPSTSRALATLEESRAEVLAYRLSQAASKSRVVEEVAQDHPVTPQEKEAEQILVRSFLATEDTQLKAESHPRRGSRKSPKSHQAGLPLDPLPRIEITLLYGSIETIEDGILAGPPVDALAVGHYIGVKPQGAELALDRVLSAALYPGDSSTYCGLLTLLSERGQLGGDLAKPFLLPDPRKPERLVVLAGLGLPGKFKVPELTVLAHELSWTLGRLGKRHLATVLIGAGNGNIPIPDAAQAWVRGIRRALTTSVHDQGKQVTHITFVEKDPWNLLALDNALRHACELCAIEGKHQPWMRLEIHYESPCCKKIKEAEEQVREIAPKRLKEIGKGYGYVDGASSDPDVPVRITVGLQGKTYEFAAITQTASIPQRYIPLDPRLVHEVNERIATEGDLRSQQASGRLLERLLIPHDIRDMLYRRETPLVLMLDSATARVHWEMIAHSGVGVVGLGALDDSSTEGFLATTHGVTRQLRTVIAPAPEPPPPPVRHLRVLIVADPAADAPLPAAQEEGRAVAELFEHFAAEQEKRWGKGHPNCHTVEVVTLLGPGEATRPAVLEKLLLERFDVLHFAGHCLYDKNEPSNTGWIFSFADDERLTANELNRIDRIPKFIFSNACESGITCGQNDLEVRDSAMAPSFAEAFFARGVANFVCTAWPVNDTAALEFACRVYAGLLGLSPSSEFEPMHVAMREARKLIARESGEGASTWGAYQHYGDPYFRLFHRPHRGAEFNQMNGQKRGQRKSQSTPSGGRRKLHRLRQGASYSNSEKRR